jgi:hypothetical protein
LEIVSISNVVDLDNISEFLDDVETQMAEDRLGKRRLKISAAWETKRISVRIEDEGQSCDFDSVM